MTVEVSKVHAVGVIGPVPGVAVSKFVAYVVMYPGAEAGSDPDPRQGFTYAQMLRRPDDE